MRELLWCQKIISVWELGWVKWGTYVFYNHILGTITSKINVTPKGVHLPILKPHSILAVANLLAHNNKSQICYCGQISLQSAAVNCSFSDTFGGNIYFAGDGTYGHTK